MTTQIEYETISTEQDRQELINMIKEADGSLIRIEAEKDLIKEIANRAKEEFEIKPADFNKVLKMYHKQNRADEQAKHEKIDSLYARLFEA